jgi:tetratricopeptide (TPR) repeat protein
MRHLILVLLAVAALVSANILPNGFLWDDEQQIVANPAIRRLTNIPGLFLSSTDTAGGSDAKVGFYRPLMFTAYTLAYRFFDLNAWGFHLLQIWFHLANVALIFLIVKKLFSQAGLPYPDWLAFGATLLFATHPVNTEAVAYLGAMGEILAAFFVLLALWVFLKNATPLAFGISLGLGLAGLFAKETAVVFFALAAVYLLLFGNLRKDQLINQFFLVTLPVGLYTLIRFLAAQVSLAQPHVVPIAQATLAQRLMTIPFELATYLGLLIIPLKLQIYRHFVVTSLGDTRFFGSGAGLILLTLGIFLIIRYQPAKQRRLSFLALAWIGLGFLPALNLIPLNMTLAERWLYLPSIGILLFLGNAVGPLIGVQPKKRQRVILGFLTLFSLLLATRSIVRTFDWRDGYTLYGRDLAKDPQNHSLANNYGVELFRKGEYGAAHELFLRSVEQEPNWATSRNNLGASYQYQGNLEKALEEYQAAFALSDYYLAYQNYPALLLKLNRAQEAKDFLETQAIPKYPNNLQLYLLLTQAFSQAGDKQKAMTLLEQILKAAPQNPQAQALYQEIISGKTNE